MINPTHTLFLTQYLLIFACSYYYFTSYLCSIFNIHEDFSQISYPIRSSLKELVRYARLRLSQCRYNKSTMMFQIYFFSTLIIKSLYLFYFIVCYLKKIWLGRPDLFRWFFCGAEIGAQQRYIIMFLGSSLLMRTKGYQSWILRKNIIFIFCYFN